MKKINGVKNTKRGVVVTGTIINAEREETSGGMRPIKLTLKVRGLDSIAHPILGKLVDEEGEITLTLDRNVASQVVGHLHSKVALEHQKNQRMAVNLTFTDIDVAALVGKELLFEINVKPEKKKCRKQPRKCHHEDNNPI